MKKIISVLSVLALLGLTSTTAFAESITQDTTGSSGTASVSYEIAPSYAVVIPSGISLDSTRTVEIKLTGLTDSEKPKLAYNQSVRVALSSAANGFSGGDGKTLQMKCGDESLSYTLSGVGGKAGKDDVVASFKYDPDKTLDDYKQTLSFDLISEPQYSGNYTDVLTFEVFSGNRVNISKLTGVYQAQDGDVLTGKGNADTHITVADGATVTLKGCDITAILNDESHQWAGITLEGDGTIVLEGINKVKNGYEAYPGIYVPENKTLTIYGSGSLDASSNGYGAGIGSGYDYSSCGNITINGGTINATGGKNGAGIGSGYKSSCGNIIISGGIVDAAGGYGSSGIGSGYSYSSCGSITVNGGTVNATGGENAAGIGSGYSNSSCGNITIKNTVVKVEATKGDRVQSSIGAGKFSTCGTVTIETGANVIQK